MSSIPNLEIQTSSHKFVILKTSNLSHANIIPLNIFLVLPFMVLVCSCRAGWVFFVIFSVIVSVVSDIIRIVSTVTGVFSDISRIVPIVGCLVSVVVGVVVSLSVVVVVVVVAVVFVLVVVVEVVTRWWSPTMILLQLCAQ